MYHPVCLILILLCWLFRWDLSLTESLPDYMKLCYKIFYEIVHEVVREAEKLQGRELLSFFRKGVSSNDEFMNSFYLTYCADINIVIIF